MNKKILIFLLIIVIIIIAICIYINYMIYIPIKFQNDYRYFIDKSYNVKIEILSSKLNSATGEFNYTIIDTINDSNTINQFFSLVNNTKIKKVIRTEATLGANYFIKLVDTNNNQELKLNINSSSLFINDKEYSTNLNLYSLLYDNIFHKTYSNP